MRTQRSNRNNGRRLKIMNSLRITNSLDPVLAISATTGLGKSHIFSKVAAENIRRLRAANDNRSIVVFVPTHKLALEQANKFNELYPDLIAKRFIGISNENPDKPKNEMCERLGVVLGLLKQGATLNSMCSDSKNNHCPHHYNSNDDPCGYSSQSRAYADIWFMPHQYQSLPMPKNIDAALIGIDESFWEASIENETESIGLESLTTTQIYKSAKASNNQYADVSNAVYEAIKLIPDSGCIDASIVNNALGGKGSELCMTAYLYSKNSMVAPAVSASMDTKQLNSILNAIDNTKNKLLSNFWLTMSKAIEKGGISPYIQLSQETDADGYARQLLKLNKRPGIHKSWNKPTVLLDATMPVEINKLFYPQLHLRQFHLTPKNTTITQLIDKTLSKRMMVPDPAKSDKKNSELERNLKRLKSICMVLASRISNGVKIQGKADPVKVLLITTKDIEEKLTEIGLPSTVATLHYKALSGLDAYKEIPIMVMAGRLELAPKIAEHKASLLTGSVVTSCQTTEAWYPKKSKEIKSRGSIDALIPSSFHPDTITEEVRESWCESELLQAIGRARAIRRTSSNPLELLILTDIPLPIKVDQLTVWADVVPLLLEIILANEGVVPLAYNEITRTNQDTINNINKARTAVANFEDRYPELNLGVVSPIYTTNRRNHTQFRYFTSLLLVQYTKAVKHAKPCKAVIHDHPSVHWRNALNAMVGEVKEISSISRITTSSKISMSNSISVAVKNLKPIGIASNGLLTKPIINLV